jgi:hypothetical protein
MDPSARLPAAKAIAKRDQGNITGKRKELYASYIFTASEHFLSLYLTTSD